MGFERRVARERDGGLPVHRPGALIKKQTGVKKLNISSESYRVKPKQELWLKALGNVKEN